MRELTFKKPSPMGEVKIEMKIRGSLIYFKYSHSEHAESAIKNFKDKGLEIRFDRNKEWIEVNLFKGIKSAKIGEFDIDLEKDKPEEIENKLAKFYTVQYIKSGFSIE